MPGCVRVCVGVGGGGGLMSVGQGTPHAVLSAAVRLRSGAACSVEAITHWAADAYGEAWSKHARPRAPRTHGRWQACGAHALSLQGALVNAARHDQRRHALEARGLPRDDGLGRGREGGDGWMVGRHKARHLRCGTLAGCGLLGAPGQPGSRQGSHLICFAWQCPTAPCIVSWLHSASASHLDVAADRVLAHAALHPSLAQLQAYLRVTGATCACLSEDQLRRRLLCARANLGTCPPTLTAGVAHPARPPPPRHLVAPRAPG